jgi:hypothetical protein
MKFSHTIKTTASPASIWKIWTDVDNWSKWDTELMAAKLDGDFELGAGGMLTPLGGKKARFNIIEFDRGNSYTFTLDLPLSNLNIYRYLESRSDGTYFTHEVSFTGLLAPLFGTILGRKFRSVLPSVMENIRRIAEG